jgi:hypothetical protein
VPLCGRKNINQNTEVYVLESNDLATVLDFLNKHQHNSSSDKAGTLTQGADQKAGTLTQGADQKAGTLTQGADQKAGKLHNTLHN